MLDHVVGNTNAAIGKSFAIVSVAQIIVGFLFGSSMAASEQRGGKKKMIQGGKKEENKSSESK